MKSNRHSREGGNPIARGIANQVRNDDKRKDDAENINYTIRGAIKF